MAQSRGLTHTRTGSISVSLGDSVTLPATVTVYGIAGGLARTMFRLESMLVEQPGGGGFFVTRQMIEESLRPGCPARPHQDCGGSGRACSRNWRCR